MAQGLQGEPHGYYGVVQCTNQVVAAPLTHWLICSQVSFTVTALSGAKLDEAEKAPGGLLKKFKLESSMATSNMNFFDSGGVAIERYATPFDICKAFYKVRLETYLTKALPPGYA